MLVELIGGPRCGDEASLPDDTVVGATFEIRYQDEPTDVIPRDPPASKLTVYRLTQRVGDEYLAWWQG